MTYAESRRKEIIYDFFLTTFWAVGSIHDFYDKDTASCVLSRARNLNLTCKVGWTAEIVDDRLIRREKGERVKGSIVSFPFSVCLDSLNSFRFLSFTCNCKRHESLHSSLSGTTNNTYLVRWIIIETCEIISHQDMLVWICCEQNVKSQQSRINVKYVFRY